MVGMVVVVMLVIDDVFVVVVMVIVLMGQQGRVRRGRNQARLAAGLHLCIVWVALDANAQTGHRIGCLEVRKGPAVLLLLMEPLLR